MPTHNECISTKKPWITKGILKCRKVKNKLYRKLLNTTSETNENIYKRYRNRFNKIKEIAKKNYYHQKFEEPKGNIRSNWKLIMRFYIKPNPKSVYLINL